MLFEKQKMVPIILRVDIRNCKAIFVENYGNWHDLI